ncbi:hypothetical protein MMAN_13540 [Mycobacterium mantenii]|uniref:Uncharacterized protein n=1 Tax=Mycobacterium mantenii TaxID=560555 RepID=A0A1X0G5D3_MYCNT|nr:DUF732 domain-containing protein [Mycobacterium mantenii]MCV7242102.1 DUF732 domain-containing protein [Mycobacterium mantenii]ORB09217.1 hypothetical protein BST30_01065 [Mycobacterium mantenii]BBY37220.1 hypothetical protein MMAN_13540 [Mycobacterium mantenii]
MTVTHVRGLRRASPVWAICVVVTALLSHVVLPAPQASADCTMTADDDRYVTLLAEKNIVHAAGYTDCHVTAEGRWFADQVRASPDPLGTARSLVRTVIAGTPLSAEQAEWEVAAAIYTYAPEMIQVIMNQGAGPAA